MADPFLDAAQIRAATFIRHAEIHDEISSTNDRAAELAADSRQDLPALVAARQQTAGRGRGEHSWWSADGALTFSVLLEPAFLGINATAWPRLSLITAVALFDGLTHEISQRAETSTPPRERAIPSTRSQPVSPLAIKWPNDIMLDGAKIAGILVESPGGTAPAKDRVIIGIGININNSWRSAPRDAGPNGTALCDFTNRRHEIQQILIWVLQNLQQRMEQLASNSAALPTAWQERCWLTEQNVDVEAGSNSVSGICLGIDTDGALLVEDVFKTHRIYSGTIRTK
jgi:BirA family transcriptional regulator, biotin operon repressor / biotin---[acetyl-CoA-carboxylase] ligase